MKRALVVLALLMLCLPGCKKTAEETEKAETAEIYTRGQGFSAEGITYVQDSIVLFADFATGETMPLCSRPNCAHRGLTEEENGNGTEGCMAYVKNAIQAVLYREKLYVFTEESGNIGIYVSEADGANRKLLAELQNAYFRAGFSTQFYDNKIVMIVAAKEVTKAEDGTMEITSPRRVVCINCETGNVLDSDKRWDNPTELYSVDGDVAYVSERYTIQEVFSLYTEEELNNNPELVRPYQRESLWQCSLTDGTTTELFAGKLGADYFANGVNKEGAVLIEHKLNEKSKIVYYSFATQEEKEVPLETGIEGVKLFLMEKGSVLFTRSMKKVNGEDNELYRYYCDSGEVKTLKIDASLLPVKVLGGRLYCLKDGMTAVMSLEDVLNGKCEVIYQMERDIYRTK